MRDFKAKLLICWRILTDQYTKATRESCWYIWDENADIMITFDSYSKYDRESYIKRRKHE